MVAKRGLEDMNGFLLKVMGDLVFEVKRGPEGGVWYRLRSTATDDLKDSLRAYIKAYNAEYGVRVSVSFPKKFRLRLRESRRRERRRTSGRPPKDREKPPAPQR